VQNPISYRIYENYIVAKSIALERAYAYEFIFGRGDLIGRPYNRSVRSFSFSGWR
jgi:hypothetical protein